MVSRDRAHDLAIRSQALYQLRYTEVGLRLVGCFGIIKYIMVRSVTFFRQHSWFDMLFVMIFTSSLFMMLSVLYFGDNSVIPLVNPPVEGC